MIRGCSRPKRPEAVLRRGSARMLLLLSVLMVFASVLVVVGGVLYVQRAEESASKARPSDSPSIPASPPNSSGGRSGAAGLPPSWSESPAVQKPADPPKPAAPPPPNPSRPGVPPERPTPPGPPPTPPPDEPEPPSPAAAEQPPTLDQIVSEAMESWKADLSEARSKFVSASRGLAGSANAFAQGVKLTKSVVGDAVDTHLFLFESSRIEFEKTRVMEQRPYGAFILSLVAQEHQCDGPMAPTLKRCHWEYVLGWRAVVEELKLTTAELDATLETLARPQGRGARQWLDATRRQIYSDMVKVELKYEGLPSLSVQLRLGDFLERSRLDKELRLIKDYERSGVTP